MVISQSFRLYKGLGSLFASQKHNEMTKCVQMTGTLLDTISPLQVADMPTKMRFKKITQKQLQFFALLLWSLAHRALADDLNTP